ncbi:MAG: NAD-binding protein, partial [Phycisphaerales bacterium]|nr:NAD-binding protein [Phycisphaerales bacterium]
LAAWIAWLLGFSPALGAFGVGLVLADSPYAQQIRSDVVPFKAVFLTLFFASIGTLAEVPWLLSGFNLLIVLGISFGIILLKIVVAVVIFRVLGIQNRVSIASALCLAQIGEFSFVIGTAASQRELIPPEVFQILTSSSLITLLLVPLLVGRSRGCANFIVQCLVWMRLLRDAGLEEEELSQLEDHVIVVGAGPAGRAVLNRLRAEGREPVIVEMNPRTVRELGDSDHHVVLGNAARGGILLHAGVQEAKSMIVTLPDTQSSIAVIEQARNLAPDLLIAVRARYKVHNHLLEAAGADIIVTEEDHVGEALGDVTIDRLRGGSSSDE